MKTINLVYIGEDFYRQSYTEMSPLYTEDGKRYDYGFLQVDLKKGYDVHIRQATSKEMEFYNKMLDEIKNKE